MRGHALVEDGATNDQGRTSNYIANGKATAVMANGSLNNNLTTTIPITPYYTEAKH